MGDAEIINMDKFRRKREEKADRAAGRLPIEVQADLLLAAINSAMEEPD